MMALMPWVRDAAFPLMEKRSKEWRRLVARWDELEAAMAAEVGIDWSKGDSAPLTYKLMKDVLRERTP